MNALTKTFTYRGDGLRNTRQVGGGGTTMFTWDIAPGLPVVLDDGNQYVYAAGLTSMKLSGNWYYYLADGLGSTMAAVNSLGNGSSAPLCAAFIISTATLLAARVQLVTEMRKNGEIGPWEASCEAVSDVIGAEGMSAGAVTDLIVGELADDAVGAGFD